MQTQATEVESEWNWATNQSTDELLFRVKNLAAPTMIVGPW